MNICVYCASSDAVAPAYFRAAEALGQMIAQRGDTLVYGGAGIGLMGALARAVKAGGGHVISVILEVLAAEPITFALLDEFVITDDMRERKARMGNPGGCLPRPSGQLWHARGARRDPDGAPIA